MPTFDPAFYGDWEYRDFEPLRAPDDEEETEPRPPKRQHNADLYACALLSRQFRNMRM